MSEPQSGIVDPVLFDDLSQILPLVQSLITPKQNSSFTRCGSIKYTKNPPKKVFEPKPKNAPLPIPTKKQTEQVEELERRLMEKEKALESEVATIQELKQQALERDSLLNSTQFQLSEALMNLADNKATLEKSQWEKQTSTREAAALRENLNTNQRKVSYMMMAFESSSSPPSSSSMDYDDLELMSPYDEIDDVDDIEMQRRNEAELAYVAAVKALKEKDDKESLAIAEAARSYLLSCVSPN